MISKFDARAETIDSLLCVGLDSDFEKLPERFTTLPEPQFAFNTWIIEETHEYATAYKLNAAFYEARGSRGVVELEKTIDFLRENYPDIYTIYDAKRGDIGNTSDAYAKAAFDDMGFDAITLNPYLGRDAIEPFLARKDRDAFFLCRTSNTGSAETQELSVDGEPLWLRVARLAEKWNTNGNCGLVMGATHPQELRRAREVVPNLPFLVPGIGVQGGNIEEVLRNGAAKNGSGLIINSSRGIIFARSPKEEAMRLRDAIQKARS